jgi:hypothetical protein
LAYNPKHPKGTKYTAGELKRRRDDWYERVKRAASTTLDAGHTEIDRRLLARLCRTCPPHLAKAFFHDQPYGASFPLGIVQALEELHNFGNEVESQFLDPDLESLFADLRAEVSKMLKALSHADAVGEKMLRILPEDTSHPYQNIQKRLRLARRAEAAAVAVYESYSTLVRECRRKLHVDLMQDEIRAEYYGRGFIDFSKD